MKYVTFKHGATGVLKVIMCDQNTSHIDLTHAPRYEGWFAYGAGFFHMEGGVCKTYGSSESIRGLAPKPEDAMLIELRLGGSELCVMGT